MISMTEAKNDLQYVQQQQQQQQAKIQLDLYKKLSNAKRQVRQETIRKSGRASGSSFGYQYFELSDIQPVVESALEANGLQMFTGVELVAREPKPLYEMRLYIIDLETGGMHVEALPFMVPDSISKPNIQLLGSQITYYRRYLLLLLFDIIESDSIDGRQQPRSQQQPQQQQTLGQIFRDNNI